MASAVSSTAAAVTAAVRVAEVRQELRWAVVREQPTLPRSSTKTRRMCGNKESSIAFLPVPSSRALRWLALILQGHVQRSFVAPSQIVPQPIRRLYSPTMPVYVLCDLFTAVGVIFESA